MSTVYTIQVHHWFPRSDVFAKQKVEAAAQTLRDSLEGHTETSVLKQSSKSYVRTRGEVAKLLEPLGSEQRSRVLQLIVWQREGDVKSLIAGNLEDLAPMLGRLATEGRDFK